MPSARTVAVTAGVALGTMIVAEALAIRGIWDWRDVSNMLAGPPPSKTGDAPSTQPTGGV